MSFGAIAAEYDRLRPAPPDAAVDWLLPANCEVAIDLAAGTGLLSRALARRVPHVIAVEPDERMAAVLRARSPGVRVLLGTGEAIPMPDASADGVFVSSAWHWMDADRAVPEIARVLRDGGRLGLIWTSRDHTVDWIGELGRIGPADEVAAVAQSARRRPDPAGRREIGLSVPGQFRDVCTKSFTFQRTMTIDDLVGMLATYSGALTASPQDRSAGQARRRAALERRFPGTTHIDVPLRSWCWRADRVSRAGPGRPRRPLRPGE
jgi:ubiquinone/menaquinone biosynthesis C-methylase UbiE